MKQAGCIHLYYGEGKGKTTAALGMILRAAGHGLSLIHIYLSKEPAGRLVMEALGLQPMLYADMCLGEGTGAVALLPVLDMAYELYFHLSRFADLPMQAYQPLA